MSVPRRHIHLEHDGKLLLVDLDGNGPVIPKMGRVGEVASLFAYLLLKKHEEWA